MMLEEYDALVAERLRQIERHARTGRWYGPVHEHMAVRHGRRPLLLRLVERLRRRASW